MSKEAVNLGSKWWKEEIDLYIRGGGQNPGEAYSEVDQRHVRGVSGALRDPFYQGC